MITDATITTDLLTPLGLRSLAPSDPRYEGRDGGDVRSRDGAYHQGTVWPWLMGPFLSAYLRALGGTPAARGQARAWLAPFEQHLREAGLGQVQPVRDEPAKRAGDLGIEGARVGTGGQSPRFREPFPRQAARAATARVGDVALEQVTMPT